METTQPITSSTEQNYQLNFTGKGSEYFTLMIVNWLLTFITLGIYYPWARAKTIKYFYGHTTLNAEHFSFLGTGKEMFKGFVKLFIFFILLIAVLVLLVLKFQAYFTAIFLFYGSILAIFPLAIHGSFKYRMSRTSYRGIRFGYRGSRKELIYKFSKWFLLTIITLGIYAIWFQMNLRKYTYENIRYGEVEFKNNYRGNDWFVVILKGYFLTIITIGIYSFWWQRDMFNYFVNNLRLEKDLKEVNFNSTATGGAFFRLMAGNVLIIIFTLGLGAAWASIRTQNFYCNHIKMSGNINMEEIHQTEVEYTNAFGDDALDLFDVALI